MGRGTPEEERIGAKMPVRPPPKIKKLTVVINLNILSKAPWEQR